MAIRQGLVVQLGMCWSSGPIRASSLGSVAIAKIEVEPRVGQAADVYAKYYVRLQSE